MIDLLAAADAHWTWELFGRFHPLTVHFPIALITVAAVLEGWFLLRKKPAAQQASWVCCWMGAAGAIVATVMGYAFAGDDESATLQLHERLGLVTCVISAITMGLAAWARKAGGFGGPALAFRSFLFLSALSVGATAHFGGEMVYPNWLFRGMPWESKTPAPPLQKPVDPPPSSSAPVAAGVDFVKDIAPIIKESCLKCHGPKKVKGKVQLDKKDLAFKKGLKPGKPDDSTFFTLLLSKDPDERMPSEADPLPQEKIDLIRKWIEQGAPWPDGFEIK